MKTIIETIPHDQQRYPTVGDWFYDAEGNLYIKVSKLSDTKREFLVKLHEYVEVKLCEEAGITQQQVDEFDVMFEDEREKGIHSIDDEPGDDPRAPYRKQHFIATTIERIAAEALAVDWESYADEVANL